MVQILIAHIQREVQAQFQLELLPHHIVHMDSTSDKKFSRHLICHLPGAVFHDNIHCGYFTRRLCAYHMWLVLVDVDAVLSCQNVAVFGHVQDSHCAALHTRACTQVLK
jgi:hypothetical protein